MRTKALFTFVFRKSDRAGQAVCPRAEQTGRLDLKVTVDGKCVKFAFGATEFARPDWCSKKQRIVSNSLAAAATNRTIIKALADLTDIHADLERQRRPVTAAAIVRLYRNYGTSALSMLGLFEAFLKERQALVGVELSQGTHEIALTRFAKLGKYLEVAKNIDFRPEDFTLSEGDKFIHWLLISEGFQRNVANKYLQSVAQVLTWAVRREYITKNPLSGYQYKTLAAKDIVYLPSEELEKLSCFEFAVPSLGTARDLFVLQSWTGLAYADLAALDVGACAETHNGQRVLRIRRAKSSTFKGYECIIPLLPEAERILSHYRDSLPVPCNQLYNRCLKQVGLMSGVSAGVPLTSHIGRKTAGVLFLNNGVPMEVVSKILGHSSVKMTEKIYAKILDTTVLDAVGRAFGPPPTPTPAPGFEPEAETGRVVQFRFSA